MRSRRRLAAMALIATVSLALAGCEDLVNLAKSKEELARERVEFILSTAKRAGGTTSDELQKAICLWWNDKIYIGDLGEFEQAMEGFEAWQQEAGIYPKPRSYEILEIRPEQEGSSTMLVLTKINGSFRWLVVPPKDTISWAEAE